MKIFFFLAELIFIHFDRKFDDYINGVVNYQLSLNRL